MQNTNLFHKHFVKESLIHFFIWKKKKKNLTSKYTRVLCSEDQGALLISDLKMRCLPVYLLSLHLGAATKTK